MSHAPLRLLLVYGGRPGGRTERLRQAAEAGIASAGPGLELISRHALTCGPDELLTSQGVLLGTPEHFGYMSGALKDFFDRTYYPAEGRTRGLPYALIVSAGNDGTGTARAVERIVTGYGWSAIAPPLIVVGDPNDAALEQAQELGGTLAAGLLAGIF
ncbi:MAG: NAD(P)H-dependent oxidoreductase [Pseudomonadota bacterium]